MFYNEVEKLKRRVKRYPERYHQEYWGYGRHSRIVNEQNPSCGTAGCLAFNTVAGHGWRPGPLDGDFQFDSCKKGGDERDISNLATEILGLTKSQSGELFDGDGLGWSKRARAAYHNAKSPEERAAAAIMELDDFMAKYRAIEAYGQYLISAVEETL